MSKITPIQESFSGGEVSPKMLGRVSSDGYQAGLATMENFIADAHGPAVRREGSRYITKVAGNDGRIFFFTINDQAGYLFVLLNLRLVPVTFEGLPLAQNYVTNPRFRDGNTGWTEDSDRATVTFSPDLLTMANDDHGLAYSMVGQEVTVPAAGDFTVAIGELSGESYNVYVGTAIGDGSYATFMNVTGTESSLVTLPGTTAWVTVENAVQDQVNQFTAITLVDETLQTDITTPWLEAELADVHVAVAPGGNIVYFMHPNHPVQKMVYVYVSDSFVFSEVVFTAPPAEWTGASHPRTGVFHEGRFWLGGTPNQPQTFWGSKSNDYENFTQGALADDSLQFSIAKLGGIRWMASTKNLLIGTSNGEHIVTSVEGVITPGDIQITQQSAYGSKGIQPAIVGDQVFYISPDGRKVRAMQYEWTADNWLSKDLTFFSEHITESGIRHIDWSQNPDNQFTCTLTAGTTASLTYERGKEIYGWHRHNFGDRVLDTSSGPIEGTDIVAMLVQRVPGEMYIEVESFNFNNYLDSWHFGIVDPDGITITDLDHLEGREVGVLTDGAVHPNKTVTAGAITLDWPVDPDTGDVVVGLPFTSTMKTLPFDGGVRTGSSQPYKKHYNKIYVSLLESALPVINGHRQPTRHPSTPMDTREPDTSVNSMIVELGWDRTAQITIEQDLPLPCTVISISGEINQEMLR